MSGGIETVEIGVANEFSPSAELAALMLDTANFSRCDEGTIETIREELETISRGELPVGPSFLPALLSSFSLLDHLGGQDRRHLLVAGRPAPVRAAG